MYRALGWDETKGVLSTAVAGRHGSYNNDIFRTIKNVRLQQKGE